MRLVMEMELLHFSVAGTPPPPPKPSPHPLSPTRIRSRRHLRLRCKIPIPRLSPRWSTLLEDGGGAGGSLQRADGEDGRRLPLHQLLPYALQGPQAGHPYPTPGGRSPLSRALSVAFILANLQMDAEVISAGILREVLEARKATIQEVWDRVGVRVAHLLHESLRVRNFPSEVDMLEEENVASLRKFCLTLYGIKAMILDLALKLDAMRHLNFLSRYQQQTIALEVMKVFAPLAHTSETTSLSL